MEDLVKSKDQKLVNEGASTSFGSRHADDSNWSEFCDESVIKLLDEPFEAEMDHLNLRNDENYRGFDNNAGSTWIYPNNYPIRQYQFNITRAALFKNTLVVLPTGLGKTFIAAVVMYNIYRWYPRGKVIFMAPTKPLVSQQIEACRKITGIPMKDTAEITGKQNKKARRDLWQNKRVFFATPHVVQNDVNDTEQDFPFHDVRLIVVDEAHKAKGHYAHAEAVRSIASRNSNFRILALSATPGRSVEDVIEVVKNLSIAHLEIRWDNSLDVIPYTHRKNIKTVVVPLGTDLTQIRNEFIDIIDPYIRFLIENKVISGAMGTISRGSLIMEQKRFREMSLTHKHQNESQVRTNFSICISLYHALELLERHGTRVFLNFFDDPSNEVSHRYYVATNPQLRQFLQKLRVYMGPNPFLVNDQTMTNGKIPEIPADLDFGHPKFMMTKERVVEHFEKNEDSKAIIFCEYRESVVLMYRALLQSRPLVKPQVFVGQGGTGSIRAVTQKQQLEVMEQFRSGVCNTLVATSVAEEGIDIGEVDLIICFDISTKNPTRFIQRIGRTGRRRQGSIIMMVTEGKEHSIMKEVLQSKDKLNQRVVKSSEVARTLCRTSPRIVPPEFNPKCLEMFMVTNDEESKDDEQSSAKKAKTTKSPKRGKGKDKLSKKLATASLSQKSDMRNFFKKVELDEDEKEIFCTIKPETSKKSFSELNVSDPGPSRLDYLIKQFEKFKKMPIVTENVGMETLLRKTKIATPIKQFVLRHNVNYVKEKFEAQQALNAAQDGEVYVLGDDELKLETELAAIEKVVGKGMVEEFIKENEVKEDTKNKLDKKFDYIFEGLEKRSFTDNVDDFLSQKMDEIRKNENCNSQDESPQEYVDSDLETYSGDRQMSPSNNPEEYEDIVVEHESRYLSQIIELDRNRISGQSTPIRPAAKSTFNGDSLQAKELFAIDGFDDSDPFGILTSQRKEDTSKVNHDPEATKIKDTGQDVAKKSDCDMFDDDFDDFFVNSKLDTDVEHLEKQRSASVIDRTDLAEHVVKNSPLCEIVENGQRGTTNEGENKISSPEKDSDKTLSQQGVEDFDYTDFFEPFDGDDVAAVEENIRLKEKQINKSTNIFDGSSLSKNTNENLKSSPTIPRQKSAELFSSNERTLPPLIPNQAAILNKYNSPPKVSPLKKAEISPSVLTRGVDLKRLRLTGSVRGSSSMLFSKPAPVVAKSPEKINGHERSLGHSIMPSQADSPIVMQRKAKRVIDSDSDIEELPNSQTEAPSISISRQIAKRRRRCQFIDDEAAVSGDEDDTEQNMENSQFSQMQLDSIVVIDDDVDDHPDVDMRARYLQSVRSPNKRPFKIPAPRVYNDMSRIFSQAVPRYEGDSVYKEDSFVISSDEEVVEEPMSQECPLERAEAILKARRREKRKNKNNGNFEVKRRNARKNRILENSSDEEDA